MTDISGFNNASSIVRTGRRNLEAETAAFDVSANAAEVSREIPPVLPPASFYSPEPELGGYVPEYGMPVQGDDSGTSAGFSTPEDTETFATETITLNDPITPVFTFTPDPAPEGPIEPVGVSETPEILPPPPLPVVLPTGAARVEGGNKNIFPNTVAVTNILNSGNSADIATLMNQFKALAQVTGLTIPADMFDKLKAGGTDAYNAMTSFNAEVINSGWFKDQVQIAIANAPSPAPLAVLPITATFAVGDSGFSISLRLTFPGLPGSPPNVSYSVK